MTSCWINLILWNDNRYDSKYWDWHATSERQRECIILVLLLQPAYFHTVQTSRIRLQQVQLYVLTHDTVVHVIKFKITTFRMHYTFHWLMFLLLSVSHWFYWHVLQWHAIHVFHLYLDWLLGQLISWLFLVQSISHLFLVRLSHSIAELFPNIASVFLISPLSILFLFF